MDRTEFLKIMRESLERKIPQAEIEDNLRYYREYFEQSNCSDEEVCEELGDPRLIAQSVTKAYLASKGAAADLYTQEARREYSQMHGSSVMNEDGQRYDGNPFLRRIILVMAVVCAVILIAFLLRLALIILLPVMVVVFLWKLLIRRDG
ncbi:MAG: DUF1700 domain-containing protein [Lachnospiraceae bacterium]|nr:DUF1700 domain-containing protein [Lachnospiraceae bacterium]